MISKQELTEKLLKLQELDIKKYSIISDLEEIPKKAKSIRDDLDLLKGELEENKKNVQQLEMDIKSLELDIEQLKTKVEKYKVQQFETKKNDEFQAIGDEIARHNHEIKNLEDEELKCIEELESAKKSFDENKKSYAEKRESVVEDITNLKKYKDNADASISELKSKRSEVSEGIDHSVLSIYERLMDGKKSAVVVQVDNDYCTGCNMQLTSTTLQSLKSKKLITNCEVCGRIVY